MRKIIFAGLLMASFVKVEAATTFGTGNLAMSENVLFGHSTCSGCVDGPATTVIGHAQSTTTLVDLTSLTSLVISGANTVTYDPSNPSAGFTSLNINVPGYYILGMMFQLTSVNTAADSTVSFVAHTGLAGDQSSGAQVFHQGGGLNQYWFTSSDLVTSVDISSPVAIHDISQISVTLQAVPEPSTLGMLGAGLAAIAVLGRRLRR